MPEFTWARFLFIAVFLGVYFTIRNWITSENTKLGCGIAALIITGILFGVAWFVQKAFWIIVCVSIGIWLLSKFTKRPFTK